MDGIRPEDREGRISGRVPPEARIGTTGVRPGGSRALSPANRSQYILPW